MIEVLGRLSFRFFTDKKEREKETWWHSPCRLSWLENDSEAQGPVLPFPHFSNGICTPFSPAFSSYSSKQKPNLHQNLCAI
jgi:hypothetical protein